MKNYFLIKLVQELLERNPEIDIDGEDAGWNKNKIDADLMTADTGSNIFIGIVCGFEFVNRIEQEGKVEKVFYQRDIMEIRRVHENSKIYKDTEGRMYFQKQALLIVLMLKGYLSRTDCLEQNTQWPTVCSPLEYLFRCCSDKQVTNSKVEIGTSIFIERIKSKSQTEQVEKFLIADFLRTQKRGFQRHFYQNWRSFYEDLDGSSDCKRGQIIVLALYRYMKKANQRVLKAVLMNFTDGEGCHIYYNAKDPRYIREENRDSFLSNDWFCFYGEVFGRQNSKIDKTEYEAQGLDLLGMELIGTGFDVYTTRKSLKRTQPQDFKDQETICQSALIAQVPSTTGST